MRTLFYVGINIQTIYNVILIWKRRKEQKMCIDFTIIFSWSAEMNKTRFHRDESKWQVSLLRRSICWCIFLSVRCPPIDICKNCHRNQMAIFYLTHNLHIICIKFGLFWFLFLYHCQFSFSHRGLVSKIRIISVWKMKFYWKSRVFIIYVNEYGHRY